MVQPNNKSLPLDGRLPLVIGITGHRDLVPADVPALEAAVQQRLQGLLEAYPHTPLVVLTALAEGADQLAARVAFRLRREYERRLYVVAPLPYEVGAYFETFTDQGVEARREFDELLGQCDLTYEVLEMEGLERWSTPPDLEPDDEGFRRLAAFLVRNSHVVLALSESGLSEAPLEIDQASGGTVTVQTWFAHGLPEFYNPGASEIDVVDGLLLQWIPVRRDASDPVPQVSPWDYSAPEPEDSGATPRIDQAPFGRGSQVFRNFEGFNSVLAREGPSLEAELRQSRQELLGHDEVAPPAPEQLAPVRDAYAAADVLTDKRFKPLIEGFERAAVVAVIVAVLAFEVYTHILPGAYLFLALYVLIFLALPKLHRILIRGHSLDEKRLVFRSLAESLRLQACWRYAGVRRMVGHYYARHARNEIEWVRQAVRGLFPCSAPMPDDPPAWQRIRDIQKGWIAEQARFFGRRAETFKVREHYVHLGSKIGLVVGFGISIFLLARYYITGEGAAHDGHLDHGTHLAIAASIFFIGVSGIAHWIEHMRAYGPLRRRYEAQKKIFDHAQQRLERLLKDPADGDLERARQLLGDLGAATLQENVSWLLLYRSRPLEIHFH